MANDIIPITEGEIVLYQPDSTTSLEVKLEQDTVWLSQAQMVELFQTSKQNVSLHINNIFKEGELQSELVVKESLTTTPHGAIPGKIQRKKVKLYNLDVIISLGYRVRSLRGTTKPSKPTTVSSRPSNPSNCPTRYTTASSSSTAKSISSATASKTWDTPSQPPSSQASPQKKSSQSSNKAKSTVARHCPPRFLAKIAL